MTRGTLELTMMSDITPVNGPAPAALSRLARPAPAEPGPITSEARGDQVQLSRAAIFLSKLLDGPEIRSDLIQRVRAEIHAGDYDTPDKIDALLDELIQDL